MIFLWVGEGRLNLLSWVCLGARFALFAKPAIQVVAKTASVWYFVSWQSYRLNFGWLKLVASSLPGYSPIVLFLVCICFAKPNIIAGLVISCSGSKAEPTENCDDFWIQSKFLHRTVDVNFRTLGLNATCEHERRICLSLHLESRDCFQLTKTG